MTLENIYYVGQTAAAAGILVSLIMVSRQLRQSQKMERATAQRDLLVRVSDWSRAVSCENEGAFDHFVLGMRDFNSAAPLTQMHFSKFLFEFIFIAESALDMRKDGFFSDGTWAGIEGAALGLVRTPGGRQWWEYGKKFIGAEILEHLNTRLEQMGPSTPDFSHAIPAYLGRLNELDAATRAATSGLPG